MAPLQRFSRRSPAFCRLTGAPLSKRRRFGPRRCAASEAARGADSRLFAAPPPAQLIEGASLALRRFYVRRRRRPVKCNAPWGPICSPVTQPAKRPAVGVSGGSSASRATLRRFLARSPAVCRPTGGHLANGLRWPAPALRSIEAFSRVLPCSVQIKRLCDASPGFVYSLADLTRLRKERVGAVREIFAEAGVDELLKNLFVVMAENGRLKHIPKMIGDYKKLMSAHRKETVVSVTAAKVTSCRSLGRNCDECRQALSKQDEKQLLASLKTKVGAERNITMDITVDPEIIGGLVVEWDDAYRMDLSVAASIKRLEAELMNAF